MRTLRNRAGKCGFQAVRQGFDERWTHQFKVPAFENFLLNASAGNVRQSPRRHRRSVEPAFLCAAQMDGRQYRLNCCLLDEDRVANKGSEESAGIGICVAARKQAALGQPVEHILDARRF